MHKRNARAIYDSIHFPDAEARGHSWEREFEESHRVRRFDVPVTQADMKPELRSDRYGVFFPIRKLVWDRIIVPYRSAHPEATTAELAGRMLDARVASFVDVTHDFTVSPSSVELETLNRSLFNELEKAFGLPRTTAFPWSSVPGSRLR